MWFFKEGHTSVVDLDMAKCFDSINHDRLLAMLKEYGIDEGACRLVLRFLKSGVMTGGLVSPTTQGHPRAAPSVPY